MSAASTATRPHQPGGGRRRAHASINSPAGNTRRQLEKLGLVRRAPNPDDRRGVLIALTPAGLALVDRVVEIHLDNERLLLAGLVRTALSAWR